MVGRLWPEVRLPAVRNGLADLSQMGWYTNAHNRCTTHPAMVSDSAAVGQTGGRRAFNDLHSPTSDPRGPGPWNRPSRAYLPMIPGSADGSIDPEVWLLHGVNNPGARYLERLVSNRP